MSNFSENNNGVPQKETENANGWRAFATLGEFLDEDGWYPQRLDEKSIYRTFFRGKNGEFRCYAQIRLDLEQFLFFAVAGMKAEEEVRLAVAEFITRANFGLRIGNFELDFSDGEVRYKSSLDFEGTTLTPALIKNSVYPAVQTMDRYLPGLMKVMYQSRTPEAAIKEIEE